MDPGPEHGNAQPIRSWIIGTLVMLWLACAAGGVFVVWAYENEPGTPGTPATVESEWPAHTSLERAADRPTLVKTAAALLNRQPGTHASTNVFGCSLFASAKS